MKKELLENIREEAFELYQKKMTSIYLSNEYNTEKLLNNHIISNIISRFHF